ncbi:MAG: hypothetical protein AAFN07_02045 [Pseudomonadota bacterium]
MTKAATRHVLHFSQSYPSSVRSGLRQVAVAGFVLALLSGNSLIFGIDLSIALMFIVATVVGVLNPEVNRRNLTLVVSFCLCLAIIGVLAIRLEVPYFTAYPLWPAKAAIGCILAFFLSELVAEDEVVSLNLILFVCFVFMAAAVLFGSEIDGRLNFIFGPNMLYRWTAIMFGLALIAARRAGGMNRLLCFGVIIFSIFLLQVIGSRGGLIALLAVFFLCSRHRTLLTAAGLSLLVMLTAVLIELADSSRVLSGLTIEAIERSERMRFWRVALTDDFQIFGHVYSDFLPFASYGFAYPHNLVVELVFHYGIFGFAVVLAILTAATLSLGQAFVSNNPLLAVLFWSIFVGSMFSGDLSDNFSVIVLTLWVLCASGQSDHGGLVPRSDQP